MILEVPPWHRCHSGVWGAVTGAAVAVGPLVGGVLVEHVSWQSIFFLNLPIGIATIAVALKLVDESKGQAQPIDVIGVSTFSAALFFGSSRSCAATRRAGAAR